MNENLNLVEILKDCPEGTKLYSTVFGEVEFGGISQIRTKYPIDVKLNNNLTENLTIDGRIYTYYDGECVLFPSKEQRDWSKFIPKKPKFDPKTLKPFDKVLVQCGKSESWKVQLFSHIIEDEKLYPYVCIACNYEYCIPYNEETKHLVGTSEEAPDYYKY